MKEMEVKPEDDILKDFSDEEHNLIMNLTRRSRRLRKQTNDLKQEKSQVLLLYPPNVIHPVTITHGDLERCGYSQYLNDSIIDFYLKYLHNNMPKDLQGKVHIFNTFFYKRYISAKGYSRASPVEKWESVQKWTKLVDIFEKDFLFIPINKDLHWSLAVV